MLAQLKFHYLRFVDRRRAKHKAQFLQAKRRELFISAFTTFNGSNTSSHANRSLAYKKVRTTADRTHLFS